MLFRQIFEPALAQYAYLIGCQRTGEAIVIDPQRDVDRYLDAAAAEGLRLVAAAETHIHADFLSGVRELAERHGARAYVSAEGGPDWQSEWATDSSAEVTRLRDGDSFRVGGIRLTAVHTPGHTPEHLAYLVTDEGGGATTPMGLVSGDFVFVGDLGRPDLLEQAAGLHGVQEPSARALYASLPRFTDLEEHLQVWPGHGAGSTCGKALGAVPTTTVGYEKRYNASLAAASEGEDAFVAAILGGQPEPQTYFARMKRDNKVGVPLLPDGGLPRPRALAADEIADVLADPRVVVLDGRTDRAAVLAAHLPGSLVAPVNKAFSAVVGSLIEDASTPLVLVAPQNKVEEALRNLVRIGYDRVVGTVAPDVLDAYVAAGGAMASIRRVGMDALEAEAAREDAVVLDVRFATEHAPRHVPGSINASYTRLPQYLAERLPPVGTPLVVHCAAGARASAAGSFLARQGYDVTVVDGPFADYSGPVEAAPAGAVEA